MTEHDNPYDGLAGEHDDDHRWAFGTGFTDPLEGIDTSVPDGLDAAALGGYCLALGDDALIYSHRLQQWMTRAPELEEETALGNIALDLLGQARMLLARAGTINTRTEDELAFLRDEHEFRNVRLVEHHDEDFAQLVGRLLLVASWRLALCDALQTCADPVLAAITGKAIKELTYHRDYAARWVVRLGDGTELSHTRMQSALEQLWPLTDELFVARPGELVDAATLRADVDVVFDTVLATAGLERPKAAPLAGVGGAQRPRRRAHRGLRLPARRAAERRPGQPGCDVVTAASTLSAVSDAWAVAAAVTDPELPMVTLADLGILRRVDVDATGVTVTITPTYSGCPAMREISHDLRHHLQRAGYAEVAVRTELAPAWSSDWITAAGRRKLAAAGIAPPSPVPARAAGPIPLTLAPRPRVTACPHCGSGDTAETAAFSGTACKSLHRCATCGEPFEAVKEI